MGTDMDDPELDRRLVGWMRAGPIAAPEDVVNRALIETTTVVQERKPKPSGPGTVSGIVIGTLLALIVFVAAVAVILVWLGR